MMNTEHQTIRPGMIVGLCNPLLDISAVTEESFLEKYELLPNNAILAEEKHKPMYEELQNTYKVDYIAGGSGQNAMRVAQRFLNQPNVTIFMGCVGKDKYSEILESKARGDGVDVRYQYTDKEQTGTCAVILTGSNRSLCANLAAANLFTKEHIEAPENKELISGADCYYITGFFLTVSPDSIMEIAQQACQSNKLFMMNLSAPFLSQFFKEPMMKAFPYIDIVFGNETEAQTFAKEQNLKAQDGSIADIALEMSSLPKENKLRSRIVVITQGKDDVVVVLDGKVSQYPAIAVPSEKIIDTNGAGDAFVGGFISQLLQGRPMEICARCGIWAATQIIQQDGCSLPADLEIPDDFRPSSS